MNKQNVEKAELEMKITHEAGIIYGSPEMDQDEKVMVIQKNGEIFYEKRKGPRKKNLKPYDQETRNLICEEYLLGWMRYTDLSYKHGPHPSTLSKWMRIFRNSDKYKFLRKAQKERVWKRNHHRKISMQAKKAQDTNKVCLAVECTLGGKRCKQYCSTGTYDVPVGSMPYSADEVQAFIEHELWCLQDRVWQFITPVQEQTSKTVQLKIFYYDNEIGTLGGILRPQGYEIPDDFDWLKLDRTVTAAKQTIVQNLYLEV